VRDQPQLGSARNCRQPDRNAGTTPEQHNPGNRRGRNVATMDKTVRFDLRCLARWSTLDP